MSLLDYLGIPRIYANGVAVRLRGALNLIGANVVDDPVNERTNITLVGGEGGGGANLSNATPTGAQAGAAASPGIAAEASRADHRHAVLTGAPSNIGTGSSNSAGSSSALARADHVHALAPADRAKLDAAGPSTPLAGTAPAAVTRQAAAAGVATEAARADHKHDAATAAPVAIATGATNSEGTSTALARADHVHALAPADRAKLDAAGPSTPLTSTAPAAITRATAAVGVATAAARADHKHDVATAAPGALSAANTSNVEGSSTSLARADHVHAVPTAAPSAVGTANATGTSTSLARADHVHAHGAQTDPTLHAIATPHTATPVGGVNTTGGTHGFASAEMATKLAGIADGANAGPGLTAAAPVAVTKAAAVVGTATDAARADHKHDVSTAAPASLSAATTTGAEGTATTLARSDHAHAVPTAAPAALTVGATAAAGTSTSLARADHVHAIAAGTPVAVGSANAAGSATSFARSDHVHDASGKADKRFPIITNAATSLTLALAHEGALITCTSTASPVIVIPRDSTLNLPIGFTCVVVLVAGGENLLHVNSQVMTGTYGIPARNAGHYSNVDSTPRGIFAPPFMPMTLTKIGADNWMITGHYA